MVEAVQKAKECDARTKVAITFGAAALTSVLSCVCSQPGDVILTETYNCHGKKSADGSSGSDLPSVVGRVWKAGGPGGFFVGLNARLAHVGGIITSQLALYDYVKQACGLPATGAH